MGTSQWQSDSIYGETDSESEWNKETPFQVSVQAEMEPPFKFLILPRGQWPIKGKAYGAQSLESAKSKAVAMFNAEWGAYDVLDVHQDSGRWLSSKLLTLERNGIFRRYAKDFTLPTAYFFDYDVGWWDSKKFKALKERASGISQ